MGAPHRTSDNPPAATPLSRAAGEYLAYLTVERGLSADSQTLYQIASCTKAFTAALSG